MRPRVPSSRSWKLAGELSIDVSADKRKCSDADLKCSISRKREVSYPSRGRSGGGAPEEPSPVRLLLAIGLGGRKKGWGFWRS